MLWKDSHSEHRYLVVASIQDIWNVGIILTVRNVVQLTSVEATCSMQHQYSSSFGTNMYLQPHQQKGYIGTEDGCGIILFVEDENAGRGFQLRCVLRVGSNWRSLDDIVIQFRCTDCTTERYSIPIYILEHFIFSYNYLE